VISQHVPKKNFPTRFDFLDGMDLYKNARLPRDLFDGRQSSRRLRTLVAISGRKDTARPFLNLLPHGLRNLTASCERFAAILASSGTGKPRFGRHCVSRDHDDLPRYVAEISDSTSPMPIKVVLFKLVCVIRLELFHHLPRPLNSKI
jgi:hypothetical protein